MNIMHKLTLRHLKENKRRTLVTIIGTIISVAMVTAVATLAISFLDLMQRQLIADKGEWHVSYFHVSAEQAETIENDPSTELLILSGDRGYSYLEGAHNQYKPYIFIKEYNENAFEKVPISLREGRFPEEPDEIVLSSEILENTDVAYRIGDTISFEVGNRVLQNTEAHLESFIDQQYSLEILDGEVTESIENTKTETYEIVGIIDRPNWEYSWSPGYTAVTYTDVSLISDNHPTTASVILNDVQNSLFFHAEELAKQIHLGSDNLSFNHELLRYHGITDNDNLQVTMYSLAAIIMTVIIVGSVALIYNAFAISVSERARHLGMLSSVGATKSQKRNSVFFEGAMIGLVSIPLGIISGLVGMGVTFWFINRLLQGALNVTEKLIVVVTPMSVLTAVLVSTLTIFISTYLPARKASKISAIDAIRQTTDVKLTGKAVKTSTLIRKLFGMEAEIGLKNIKRNKRKYKVTVFSLTVSIILFLVVSFFTYSLEKSIELSQQQINYDIQLTTSGNMEFNELSVEAITSLEDVTSFSMMQETYSFYAMVEEGDISERLKEIVEDDPSILEDGHYPYFTEIHALDDESLKTYAQEIGMNVSPLLDEKTFSAIVVDRGVYEDVQAGRFVEFHSIHTSEGEQLDIYFDDWENDKKDFVSTLTIEALTDQLPMGVTTGGGISEIKVFVSEAVFQNLIDLEGRAISRDYIYLNSSDPLKTQEEIEDIDENLYIYNVYQSRQQSEQLVLLMSVFIYGFIVLITVISIANIFNTISTSISLRKREFAMLKSVGMTPKSFNKMMNYESIFYGIKSLLYGIPISIGIMYLLYKAMMNTFEYRFEVPWMSILVVVIAVFVIVGSAMLYSISKVKKENIIEALKQENI
ncbi:FtsX-like permease family protein [Evansella cellulosilytica]|uniref:Cell division protein FtsX n=1 Tax=Evansella cellulosilytica (strain ATCC 21833 / DSM 2522 / FERM P-1141 / JCM 9156 / N-4) TaxID=649639 RepID=E6TZ44_EVAC2|nr:FtsX-like permease family protein [Evansella cellulosilytica]ADU32487.1 protein of unknown function DUF214 [Evansella cellulosilytica DSM 2522]